ncbi:MAG TPA: hypothetical protein V6C71_25125 [Coleofasciculaceae cyanobacterium]|jgi:hypothetical protein
MLQETLAEQLFEPNISKEALLQLRKQLQLEDEEHDRILAEIIQEQPNLIYSGTSQRSRLGLARTKLKIKNNPSDRSAIKPIQNNRLHQAFTKIKLIKKQTKNYSQVIPTKIRRIAVKNHQNSK